MFIHVGAKMNGVKIYEGVQVESVTERIVNGQKYVSGTNVFQCYKISYHVLQFSYVSSTYYYSVLYEIYGIILL